MSEISVLRRDDADYETARRATVANARRPDRRPDAIVRAHSAAAVAAAVDHARREGWRIAVCSGGHSWAGSHLRDGGMLIDLSALTHFSVDAEARTAIVEPGLRSSALTEALAPLGLFFPTGHCIGPCLGGFLLQGGFGWNSRHLGPACMSVEAIDVVLADGTMVRAAEDEHADLFWAARGAGPGFFGVVTRFYVRLHDRPAVQLSSAYHFGPEHLDELMTWAHAVGPSVPDSIELMVFMRRDLMGVSGPGLQLLAPVLAASEDQAHEDAAFLNSCPILDRANAAEPMVPTDVRELVAHSSDFYPEGWRYAVDNTWTHATADELMPHYRHIVETLPDSPSHAMWMNWHPDSGPQRPDMAYSLEDDVYLGLYGVWRDERDDGRFRDWATTRMRALEPLSSGIQLADENLARRPARFVSDDNLRRLDEVRDRYDPDGVFHEWLARPTAR